MMLAAALCAEGKAAPPPELVMAWRCGRFRALPLGGGVLDQPAGLLDKMDAALNAWTAWGSWMARQAGHEGEWAEKHPAEWALVQKIMEMIDG
jgi:hypothetical protein